MMFLPPRMEINMRSWGFTALFVILHSKVIISDGDLPTGARIVEKCPEPNNETAWEMASIGLGCSHSGNFLPKRKFYHCLPSSSLNEFVAFCGIPVPIDPGNCPVFHYVNTKGKNRAPSSWNCSTFTSGCPGEFYHSRDVYNYPNCLDIDRGRSCFRADTNCTSDLYSTSITVEMGSSYPTKLIFSTLKTTSSTEVNTSKGNGFAEQLSFKIGFFISIGLIVLLLSVVILFILKRKKKRNNEGSPEETLSLTDINQEEKEVATATFDCVTWSPVTLLLSQIAEEMPEAKIQTLKFLLKSSYRAITEEEDKKISGLQPHDLLLFMDRKYNFNLNMFILMGYLENLKEENLLKKCNDFVKNAVQPLNYYAWDRGDAKESTKVFLKLAMDIEKFHRQNLNNIMETMKNLLNCKEEDIIVKQISEGCILLHLDVKDSLIETLRSCDVSSMVKHRVFKISIVDECIFYDQNLDDNFHKKVCCRGNFIERMISWFSFLKRISLKMCKICQERQSRVCSRKTDLESVKTELLENSKCSEEQPNEKIAAPIGHDMLEPLKSTDCIEEELKGKTSKDQEMCHKESLETYTVAGVDIGSRSLAYADYFREELAEKSGPIEENGADGTEDGNKLRSLTSPTDKALKFGRTCHLLLGPCTDALRDVLRRYVPPSTFPCVINRESINLPPLKKSQMKLILPRHSHYMGNYNDMDFSLLYTLIRNICDMQPHNNGWGNYPDPEDRSISANIERIRLARYICAHFPRPDFSDADFNTIWSTCRAAAVDIDCFLNKKNHYEQEVDNLKKTTMHPVQQLYYTQELIKQTKEDDTIIEKVPSLRCPLWEFERDLIEDHYNFQTTVGRRITYFAKSHTHMPTEETEHTCRACLTLLGPCTDQLRDVLRHHVSPLEFTSILEQKINKLFHLTATQRNLILPKNSIYSGNYDDMDISLLYILLRNICDIPQHSNDWGNAPDPTDRCLSANIERIRIARDQCVHSSSSILSKSEFNTICTTLRSAFIDLDSFLENMGYNKRKDDLKYDMIDHVDNFFRGDVFKTAERLSIKRTGCLLIITLCECQGDIEEKYQNLIPLPVWDMDRHYVLNEGIEVKHLQQAVILIYLDLRGIPPLGRLEKYGGLLRKGIEDMLEHQCGSLKNNTLYELVQLKTIIPVNIYSTANDMTEFEAISVQSGARFFNIYRTIVNGRECICLRVIEKKNIEKKDKRKQLE